MPHNADSKIDLDSYDLLDTSNVQDITKCPMHFVIVGDSVAGFGCAFTLSFAGHKVTVVEAADEATQTTYKLSGGIKFPPNISRRLIAYPGTLEILREKGTKVNAVEFRSDTDQVRGRMIMEDDIMSDLGSDYYLLPYHDYTVSRKFCVAHGVDYHYNFKVARIETSEEGPAVVISEDGRRIEGDVIIGADGRNSIVRQYLVQQGLRHDIDSDEPTSTVESLHNEILGGAFSILIEDMIPHPELQGIIDSEKVVVWMGNGCTFIGGRHGPMYLLSLVEFRPLTSIIGDADFTRSSWEQSSLASFMDRHNPEDNVVLKKLISIAKDGHPTLEQLEPIDSFVDKYSRAVLVGDAAHCAPMYGTHNSAIAIEDALALGKLLTHLTHPSQIPMFLRGFNEIRVPRSKIVSQFELECLRDVMLAPGPLRDARDARLKESLASPGNMQQWSEWIKMADYDVFDAVNEWWLMWGRHVLKMGEDEGARSKAED